LKIAIATDAWRPQVNGVVTTLSTTQACLEQLGHEVLVLSPDGHRTVPCPMYPEIRLAITPRRRFESQLSEFGPDVIHAATEGPLGLCARRFCLHRSLAFTTSYHTQFPKYVRARVPIPESWSYVYLRRHHGAARRTLVATPEQRRELFAHGFENVVIWTRGVDTGLFAPAKRHVLDSDGPIFLYAGRVAVEKNLEAFLGLDLPGTKYVVGDGPDLAALRREYPRARFVGYKFGQELAGFLASADVFVFPSRTDTFGLVMLESMACGTPVAAYPVTGPIDVVEDGATGILSDDLRFAALAALDIDRRRCRSHALERTWEKATQQFLSHLVLARSGQDVAATVTAR
jgi:glycosyltransferase involved in cell wall biosynthesis